MKPNLKEAYNDLGRALNDLGRPDEALKYLEAALKLEPNYVSALINRGIALAKLGRYTRRSRTLIRL
jgi:tetratricopeptide (TPR) repeat protein